MAAWRNDRVRDYPPSSRDHAYKGLKSRAAANRAYKNSFMFFVRQRASYTRVFWMALAEQTQEGESKFDANARLEFRYTGPNGEPYDPKDSFYNAAAEEEFATMSQVRRLYSRRGHL